MYLISPETLKGKIDDYFSQYMTTGENNSEYQMWELIGYWPVSEHIYFSCRSKHGEVVPVFLGHTIEKNPASPYFGQMWYFHTEYKSEKIKGEWFHNPVKEIVGEWALFFVGCDDGHCGKRFVSKEAALEWIANNPEIDFKQVVWGNKDYGLEWHN
jgi:hypothetical protein